MSERKLSDKEMTEFSASRALNDADLLDDGAKFVVDKDKKGKKLEPRLQVEKKFTGPKNESILKWINETPRIEKAVDAYIGKIYGQDYSEEDLHLFEELDKEGLFLKVAIDTGEVQIGSKKSNTLHDIYVGERFDATEYTEDVPMDRSFISPMPGLQVWRRRPGVGM